jgi:hypothetical protein
MKTNVHIINVVIFKFLTFAESLNVSCSYDFHTRKLVSVFEGCLWSSGIESLIKIT